MSLRKATERAGKQVVRAALRVWLRPGRRADSPVPEHVRRVCVVRGDNRLGNLLLITPLLVECRRIFANAQLDVLISGDAYPDVYRHQTFLDEVVTAPKKRMARNPLRTIPFSRMLRERKYDVVIDASHMHEFSLTTAWAAQLTRAPWRVGYARGDAELFLNWLVNIPTEDELHECDVHLQLLRDLLPDADVLGPRRAAPHYDVQSDEKRDAAERFRAWGLTPAEPIGLFVGARGRKKWPVSRFVEIAEKLVASGTPCILFGGPVEQDELDGLQTSAVVAPPLDLRAFAAALASCRLVVSADTGPMHLAVAVGCPTVELFFASDPRRYGYAHLDEHLVVEGNADEGIAPETVLDAVTQLLPAHRAAEPA